MFLCMHVVNFQECGCIPEQKFLELVDEVKAIKEIVLNIKDFLHEKLQPLPSVASCQTPPPLPPPVPLTSFSPLVPSSAYMQSPISSYHTTSIPHFVPTHYDPISLQLQQPISLSNVPDPLLSDNTSAPSPSLSYTHPPCVNAPFPAYLHVPSSTHPTHTLALSSTHSSSPLSTHTPVHRPPLSSAASFNTAISPPVPPSPSSLLSPTIPLQPHQSSQHTAGIVNEVRLLSCSRSNFCANMVRQLFTVEERMRSNVRGKLGKSQLDPARLAVIRQAALQMYPLGTGEREELVWRQCIKAIDESCRRLKRNMH